MTTKILKIKGDWNEVLNDSRATVGKKFLTKEPSDDFKKKILISEHSTIRSISIKWVWKGLKSWIATHFSRHKWECFIRTQRTDRTGIDRDQLPQGALVDFVGEANTQHVIDTSRKRLCFQASKETREAWEDLKIEIEKEDSFIPKVMVPNCIYRMGCPELNPCGLLEKFIDYCHSKGVEDLVDIQQRYDLYDEFFHLNRVSNT